MKIKERDIAIQAINMIEIYLYQGGQYSFDDFIKKIKKKYKITDKDIPFWNWKK